MGKGGASKGAVSKSGAAVSKPWLKKTVSAATPVAAKIVPAKAAGAKGKGKSSGKTSASIWSAPVSASAGGKSASKGSSAGGKSSSKGSGSWVFVPEGKKASSKGSKGNGKGKGKGKGRRPAAVNSEFWSNKIEGEGREVLGDETYTGVIVRYTWAQAWGLIKPDDPDSMPEQVKEALRVAAEAAAEKAAAKGKDAPDDGGLLYFRKPDINHQEGFKVTKDVMVTFSLYVDEKGAGACEVSPAA